MGARERGAVRPKTATELADPELYLELKAAERFGVTLTAFYECPEDHQRRMIQYVRDICRECGNPKAICGDHSRKWLPRRHYCYVTAARNLVERRLQEKYKDKPPADKPHDLDGLSISMDQEGDPDFWDF